MASSSMRNIISILALCEGSAIVIRDQYKDRIKNKTSMALIGRVIDACKSANDTFHGEVDQREVARIHERLKKVEGALFLGDSRTADVTVYTSLCLGLISDLYDWIRDPVKLAGSFMILPLCVPRYASLISPSFMFSPSPFVVCSVPSPC